MDLTSILMAELLLGATPEAQALINKALQREGPQGDVVRTLHAQPERVIVDTRPNWLQQLDNFMTGGQSGQMAGFHPGIFSNDAYIDINPVLSKNYARANALPLEKVNLETLAHESGHALAQISKKGGLIQPYENAIPNFLYQLGAAYMPGLSPRRIPAELNESVADALAGTKAYGDPSSQAQSLADQIKQFFINRQPTLSEVLQAGSQ